MSQMKWHPLNTTHTYTPTEFRADSIGCVKYFICPSENSSLQELYFLIDISF